MVERQPLKLKVPGSIPGSRKFMGGAARVGCSPSQCRIAQVAERPEGLGGCGFKSSFGSFGNGSLTGERLVDIEVGAGSNPARST